MGCKKNPDGYWHKIENRRAYVKGLGDTLGFQIMEDWYRVTKADFENNGGVGVFDHYRNNRLKLLEDIFPDYTWLPWLFTKAGNKCWQSRNVKLKYMAWLADRLGYENPDDWYAVTKEDFKANSGSGILAVYHNSHYQVLVDLFPEKTWLPWLMAYAPNRIWKTPDIVRWYLDWLGQRLGVRTLDDWYNITKDDFEANFGGPLLNNIYSGIYPNLFLDVFPGHNWKPELFHKGKQTQKRIFRFVKETYPDAMFDYKHPGLLFTSGRRMEFDIWIPSLNLGIEYQGEGHFKPIYGERNLTLILKRDAEKRLAAAAHGILLIEVAYFDWPGDKAYIEDLIKKAAQQSQAAVKNG